MQSPRLYESNITNTDREYLFRQAADRTGLPAYIIEKDYVVSLTLSILFSEIKPKYLENCQTPFLFKGGTSLSKVFGVINRMSEDIDLSINMAFLGYPEPENESNSARDRRVSHLLERNILFVTELREAFVSFLTGIRCDFDVQLDLEEPQNLIINYPRSLTPTDYFDNDLRPHVLIETGGRAAFEPHVSQHSAPIMLNEIRKALYVDKDCCTSIDVLSMERTFFEKLTLLHELNHRGTGAVNNRQARHLYDLLQIYQAQPGIIDNLKLLEDVRQHKAKYFRRSTARWDLAVPGTMQIIPPEDVKIALKEDWNKMEDLFPNSELPYTFEQIMKGLTVIDGKINKEKSTCHDRHFFTD